MPALFQLFLSSLLCTADRTLVPLDCLFLANTEQILHSLGKMQLVVIKTEGETEEENWVIEVAEKRNCWDIMREKKENIITVVHVLLQETNKKDLQKKMGLCYSAVS